MTQVNWDALNQAARANEASRRSAEAVCAFAEALAERLDTQLRGPVSPVVSDVFRSLRDDLLAVVSSFRGDNDPVDPGPDRLYPEPQAPASRPPADPVDYLPLACGDSACTRTHGVSGRHTS